MENKDLYDEKFYEVNRKDLNAASIIISYILSNLKIDSVVDFGCGSGTWISEFKRQGVKDVLGIDGDYVQSSWQLIDSKFFKPYDLTKKLVLDKKYDLAVTLEVAEHIDKKYEDVFVENLISASDIILFSAAVPNQGGTGHVNEQYPTYWIEKFKKRGYEYYDCLRWKFWEDNEIAFWYRQNIMFYVKKEKYAAFKKLFEINGTPINIIHPKRLENISKDFDDYLERTENEISQKNNIIVEKDHELSEKDHELLEKNQELIEKMNEFDDYKKLKEEELNDMKKQNQENKKLINFLEDMNAPKVSVVVPVFNVKSFLKECLDSILNQTLKQIEVICGDGGSTDGSLEILREYEKKDPRVRVISKKGSGYGQSVNECMDMARGEYIGIVESDDKVAPDMYEILYCEAKTKDLDWIRSDIYFYYSGMPKNKQLSRESIVYGNNDLYHKVLNPQVDTAPYNSALHTWAGIYKKSFLDKYHIRHHETPGGSYQDVGFYLRTLYYATRVYFLDKPFYYWRQDNPGSSIHYNSKSLVEKSKYEWELNKEYLLYSSNVTNMQWGSFNFRRYFSYQWTIEMAEGEYKEEMRKFAKKELKEAYDKGQVMKEFFDENEWNKFLKFIK